MALLAVTGCLTRQTSPFDRADPNQTAIQIAVENREFSDATIYAESSQRRERLGIVTGKGNEIFEIDWPAVQDLAIRIDLLAGQTHTTRRLTVAPGDAVTLYIERPLRNSVLER